MIATATVASRNVTVEENSRWKARVLELIGLPSIETLPRNPSASRNGTLALCNVDGVNKRTTGSPVNVTGNEPYYDLRCQRIRGLCAGNDRRG